MTTDELVKVNKDYFIKASSIALKAAILGAFPYLVNPPFSYLLDQVVNWMVGKLATSLELVAFFEYIDFRTDAQGKIYVEASHQANTLQTKEAQDKADVAFKNFVKFSN